MQSGLGDLESGMGCGRRSRRAEIGVMFCGVRNEIDQRTYFGGINSADSTARVEHKRRVY